MHLWYMYKTQKQRMWPNCMLQVLNMEGLVGREPTVSCCAVLVCNGLGVEIRNSIFKAI